MLSFSFFNCSVEREVLFRGWFFWRTIHSWSVCVGNASNSSLSESFIDAHTPYGILVNNYGVCESYSEAFALVGRMAGLDVIIETGYLQGGGHEWNRVCVDGQWCIIDVTNNDIDSCRNALLNVL